MYHKNKFKKGNNSKTTVTPMKNQGMILITMDMTMKRMMGKKSQIITILLTGNRCRMKNRRKMNIINTAKRIMNFRATIRQMETMIMRIFRATMIS